MTGDEQKAIKQKSIDEFIERVQYLPDTDYGDFKRKLDLAMMQLWNILGHDSQEIDQMFWENKKEIVYQSRMTVEQAREKALLTAEKLRQKV